MPLKMWGYNRKRAAMGAGISGGLGVSGEMDCMKSAGFPLTIKAPKIVSPEKPKPGHELFWNPLQSQHPVLRDGMLALTAGQPRAKPCYQPGFCSNLPLYLTTSDCSMGKSRCLDSYTRSSFLNRVYVVRLGSMSIPYTGLLRMVLARY